MLSAFPAGGDAAGPSPVPRWAGAGRREGCLGVQHWEFSVKLPFALNLLSLVEQPAGFIGICSLISFSNRAL